MSAIPQTIIVGSGFAGLETAFLLRMRARDKADITLVSERSTFTFRPNTIYIPFGAAPDKLVFDLDRAARASAQQVQPMLEGLSGS